MDLVGPLFTSYRSDFDPQIFGFLTIWFISIDVSDSGSRGDFVGQAGAGSTDSVP